LSGVLSHRQRSPSSAAGGLDRRLVALGAAAGIADGRLEEAPVEEAQAIVRRAGERLGHGLEATVVALAGPTGAGKSTLFNALAGRQLVTEGVRRPTTSTATAAIWGTADPGLLDWLEVPARHALDPIDAAEGLVLLDLPDFDSVQVAHRLEVDRLVRLVDLLVWVVDPQKYADASLHDQYLRPLAGHAAAMLVVLNQADRLGAEAPRAAADLQRLLASEGLGDMPVMTASARTGEGVDALRTALAERVARREAALERLAADVSGIADRLAAAAGEGRPAGFGRRDREALVATFGAAAGLPAVEAAVRRAHRRRGVLATGLPWVAWVRRLRPDPLKRLRLGDTPSEEVRTSLPSATPVQRAQVDAAVRVLAGDAAHGLEAPWPALARRAATAREDEVADRLDRAVAGADLRMTRPRWWTPVRWLQIALAAVAVAGLVWLALLAGLGYLQLDDALPTPEIFGFPAPTALLAGGLLAGVLVAFLARVVNRSGAKRRARRARRALDARVSEVADELVVEPLQAELAARERLLEALATARAA
jgi:GTP-binding protein EngB required for normal cell division